MAKSFVLLALFIVIVYVYSIRKIKQNKEKTKNINTVRDFHNTYGHLISRPPSQEERFKKRIGDDSYRRYVTKYNSSEDYREKR